MSISTLKGEICDIGRRMWQRGYCAGNDGNISVRLSAGRVLCTPTGISKGFMQPRMLVQVDMNGEQTSGMAAWKRTSEILLHLALYQKRGDAGAVVHAHAPYATAFACAGGKLPRGIYPEAEVCLGHVPVVAYAKAGYRELGEAVAKEVDGRTCALLMGNHGAVTLGVTLEEAYHKLEMLEAYCRLLAHLKQIGSTKRLTRRQLAEL